MTWKFARSLGSPAASSSTRGMLPDVVVAAGAVLLLVHAMSNPELAQVWREGFAPLWGPLWIALGSGPGRFETRIKGKPPHPQFILFVFS